MCDTLGIRNANCASGIDVQSELALKGSPHLRPTRPPMAAQASPMQKAMLNRQQGRQRPIIAPPLQTVNQSSLVGGQRNFGGSPSIQPTPPSQHSSPATATAKSPAFAIQGGMVSPNSDFQGQAQQHPQRSMTGPRQQQQQHLAQQRHMRNISGQTSGHGPNRSLSHTSGGAYYHPQFQKHYDQLGKYIPSTPSTTLPGALFVLGLFREYRTGVRCTRWYARRSRRRRTGSRPIYSEFQTTSYDRRTKHDAGVTAYDYSIRRRFFYRRYSWNRPIRPDAGCRSIWVDSKHAFSQSFQFSTTAAEEMSRGMRPLAFQGYIYSAAMALMEYPAMHEQKIICLLLSITSLSPELQHDVGLLIFTCNLWPSLCTILLVP